MEDGRNTVPGTLVQDRLSSGPARATSAANVHSRVIDKNALMRLAAMAAAVRMHAQAAVHICVHSRDNCFGTTTP